MYRHTHVYIYTFFFQFFPIIGYFTVLGRAQQALVHLCSLQRRWCPSVKPTLPVDPSLPPSPHHHFWGVLLLFRKPNLLVAVMG